MEWVAIPFSTISFNPGSEPRSPALQADSLLPEPPGKPTYIAPKAQSRGESAQGPLRGSAPLLGELRRGARVSAW